MPLLSVDPLPHLCIGPIVCYFIFHSLVSYRYSCLTHSQQSCHIVLAVSMPVCVCVCVLEGGGKELLQRLNGVVCAEQHGSHQPLPCVEL